MKLFRYFLLLPVLLVTSCGDKYYVTDEVIMNTKTMYYPISSRDWILMDTAPTAEDPNEDSKWTYFYCDFNEPILTNWQFNNGIMNAFLSTNDGPVAVLAPLPYDNFLKTPDGFMWTEQATCEFSPGNIRFIIKYSDFEIGSRPLPYTFAVHYAW